jgi:hypothetical protein
VPPAPAISRLVYRNAIDPGSQVRLATETTDTLESSQERFLRQVARLLAIFGQAEEKPVNFAGALGNELFESCCLPPLQSFNELGLCPRP